MDTKITQKNKAAIPIKNLKHFWQMLRRHLAVQIEWKTVTGKKHKYVCAWFERGTSVVDENKNKERICICTHTSMGIYTICFTEDFSWDINFYHAITDGNCIAIINHDRIKELQCKCRCANC